MNCSDSIREYRDSDIRNKGEEEIDRRGFIRRASVSAATVVVGATFAGCGYASTQVESDVFTIPREDVPRVDGEPFRSNTGKFFLVHNNDGLLALSWACTHLGCTTIWSSAARQFQCPCHGSDFEFDGSRISGPASRPLDLFTITSVKNGAVHVRIDQKHLRASYEIEQATPYE